MSRSPLFIQMAGGFRDDVGIAGIKAGELSLCRNIEPSISGGYVKTGQFERFDGRPAPSKAADEAAATVRRNAITALPGVGRVLGVTEFKGDVIAVRNVEGNTSATMWKSSPAGWVAIKTMLPPNGRYRWVQSNFYAGAASLCLYGVSGTHQAFEWNGTTFGFVSSGMPRFIAVYKKHLFLGFPGGSLQHSGVGNPYEWSAGTAEFGMGSEITALQLYKGGLIIGTETSIQTIFGASRLDWAHDVFTDQNGVQADTLQDVVGDLFFCHSAKAYSFRAAQEYGKFQTASISQRINNSLQNVGIKFAITSPEKGLFLIQANDRRMFSMLIKPQSFEFGIRQYPFLACCAATSDSGSVFVGDNNGFIYQLDRGLTADGANVDALMRTGYRTPKSGFNYRLHEVDAIFSGITSQHTMRVDGDLDEQSSDPSIVDALPGGAVFDAASWDGSLWDSYPPAVVRSDQSMVAESFAVMIGHCLAMPFRLLSLKLSVSFRGARNG